jgi:probable HAF family extracellular repeat protein
MTDLGTLGGDFSNAQAINNHGQIVGAAQTASGGYHDFVWENGVMYDLDALLPANSGWMTKFDSIDINDTGQIAGTGLLNGVQRAFLISDNDGTFANGGLTISNLGTLGGSASEGYGINKSGQVVGDSGTKDGRSHAFRYSTGVMTDLKTLVGNPTLGLNISGASAINDAGQIVGTSVYDSTGNYHAVTWQSGKINDLNKELPRGSAWVLTSATDINVSGKIVGSASIGGQNHAFLLVPSSLALQTSSVHTASAATTLLVESSSTPTNSTDDMTPAVQVQSTAASSPPNMTATMVDLVFNTAPLDRPVPALHARPVIVNDDLLADFSALEGDDAHLYREPRS